MKHNCTSSKSDITKLLQGLRDIGVYINEGANNRIYIRDDWQHNEGDIIFDAQPVGIKHGEYWYRIFYSDAFNSLIGVNLRELN